MTGSPIFSVAGKCPICEQQTKFNAWSEHLRDNFLCASCGTIPRERALMVALDRFYPNWRELSVHESSPAERGVSKKLAEQCRDYTPTQYSPDVAEGSLHADGWRCENLERQTFADATFDLVITQDVLEHLFDPDAAFREIARTLRPGGAHIATTPIVFGATRATIQCAARNPDGSVNHFRPPDYHHNPVDPEGSLVTFWWGYDIATRIDRAAPFNTLIFLDENMSKGISGPLNEVLVSYRL